MSNDYLAGAPTVGSQDYKVTTEELQAALRQQDRVLNEIREKLASTDEDKPKKIKWKKVRKFFKTFIVPILNFIPKAINAVTNFMNAKAKFA